MPAPRHTMDPFQQIRRELDQVFDRILGEGFGPMLTSRSEIAAPTVQLDVSMEGDTVRIEADLPGVEPQNVECTFQDGVLTISGERRDTSEGRLVQERRFGRFQRRITLPEGTDEDSLDARFQNGVLTITARMMPGVGQQRRIQVSGTSEGRPATDKQQPQSVPVQPKMQAKQPQGEPGQQAGPQGGAEREKNKTRG